MSEGTQYQLQLTLVYANELLYNSVAGYYPATERARAERDYHLLAAWCRYLNAGGNTLDGQMLLDAILMDFQLPDGWELLQTSQEVPETQHIFWEPATGKALVISEDQFTQETTLDLLGCYDPGTVLAPGKRAPAERLPAPGEFDEHGT